MKTKIALMLFTLIIALGITGAVSATDVLTDKNCNTNYQWDNQDNCNEEDECNEKYNDQDYIKDSACYAEPICDKCRNYEYRCKCREEVKYYPSRSDEDKCKERYDTCRKTVDKCDKRPKYKKAAVGDRVWNDLNANGIQDANEPGIEGITVNLWTNVNNAPGSIIKTTTTNAAGNYLFTNIVPGTYWLQFVLPDAISSWIFALQNQGTDDAIDSDADANGIAGPIELASGEVDLTWDAGLDPGAAAGGDEEPTDGAAGGDEGAAGGEEVAAAGEEELGVTVAAAGEPPTVSAAEIAMQETGMPINYLIIALLMILGGLYRFRR